MVRCKICNNKTYILYDKQFDIKYYRCNSCDFIYEDIENHISFKREKKIYELHNNSIDNEGYVNMFNKFIDSFESFLVGKKLLEFGSGPAPVFAELMRKRNYDVTIYDPYYFSDKLFKDNKYDVITSTEVFEHFVNPLGEIEMLVGLLNKEGILAIMTQFSKQDDHFLNWWYRRDETHISFYNEKTFMYIAEKFNLKIVYTNNKDYMILKRM